MSKILKRTTMATKTSSKTATRKTICARGTTAARKPAAAAKAKLPKQKLEEDVGPAAKSRHPSTFKRRRRKLLDLRPAKQRAFR